MTLSEKPTKKDSVRCPSLVDLALARRAEEQCCAASMEETRRGRVRTQLSRPRTYEVRHPMQVHRCEWPAGCKEWVKFDLCEDHKEALKVRSKLGLPWNATFGEVRKACYRDSAGASSSVPAQPDAVGARDTRLLTRG
jgi:hypothetical protein